MVRINKLGALLAVSLAVLFGVASVASAAQSASTTYSVDETFFGNGGVQNACSATYCSYQTAGDTAVGNTKSTTYQAQAGSLVTDRAPYIEVVVNNPNTNLGTLTTATTATATATFRVKTYLAGGYIVVSSSPGPQNNGVTMHNLSTPTGSSVGNEQFGINLVANTVPASFGAAPSQVPGSAFSFGQVSAGYNTTNLYKYVNGDTIAYSNSSSGETDYTISYIFNISNVTPGGTYVLEHSIVATSTY